ncbi:MAG TPA: hypothetical protein VGD02_07155 [Gemmatimonadaceae bacterium]|jgi:hypothetical protein
MKRRIVLGIAALSVSGVVQAQVAQSPSTANPDRATLEQQLRVRTANVLQKRLGLSSGQMDKLEQSNRKFAPQLARVAAQERDTRKQLRGEMQSPTPNQQRVSDLLNTSLQLQRQRLDLVDAEQKDLSGFMTPVQRAGYLAFQIQLRRRAEQLANQNGGVGMIRRAGAGRRP